MIPTVSAGDEAALLTFKAQVAIDGSSGMLASWNSSTSFCSWEGVTCSRRRPTQVSALNLQGGGIKGALPPAIGNLTYLQTLNLSANELYGEIPASLGHLRRLETLDLSNNLFSGEFPANLSSCISMTIMVLDGNKLGGHIPAELGAMTSLEAISLSNNSFAGPIPVSLANLSHLQYLSLSSNQLDGSIPPGLGSIQSMWQLHLYNNNLSGLLPLSLYNLSSLISFQVGGNMLHGSIPTDIGNRFPSMQILSLSSNQFTGIIPSSVSNLSHLTTLNLEQNRLSGHVPATLGRVRALQNLLLTENKLEANDKEGWEFINSLSNCSQLRWLILSDNSFGGHLPGSVVNLSVTLQKLYLDDNRISGSIPADIGNLVGLNILLTVNNSMSGVIPDSIGKLENLVDLGLYGNALSGLIPPSIGNLTKLTRFLAFYNNLEGPIPESLGKLKNLFILDLSTNYYLNGSIPKAILKLPSLSWYLDLSYNSLSGPLPSEVGTMTNLNELILSGNKLSGQIPSSIGNCIVLVKLLLDKNSFEGSIPQSLSNLKGLSVLNLTMNNLSGRIPDAIGSIRALQQLYLAQNNLSGSIPEDLQNLTSLSILDLSFNNLQGEVPDKGAFRNLTYISVAGNNQLCSKTHQLHLATCSTSPLGKDKKKKSKSLVISLLTSIIVLSSVSVILLVWMLWKKRKQRHKSTVESPIAEQYERISYLALSRGTNEFSEDNLLGSGRYGAVYKCILDNQDKTLAVKVFNLCQSGSSKSFEAECEAMRRIRHRRLIKIITCCSSTDPQGQEFKALVFEFMPNGSLDLWLHKKSQLTSSRTLSLSQRLDIAVDIVTAVEYLHNNCQPQVIHCDLKPSNILLAEDMSARVGDFGISKFLPENTRIQNSYSSIGIRGSIGYVAPEYGEGSAISTSGDIYSLGILLLEMFTSRSPTDNMFRDSLDLYKFTEEALPDRTLEIADSTIWLHKEPKNSTTTGSRIQECLISIFRIGLSCSKQQPRERASIRDVVVEMHAVRDAYLMFGN
ncbi:unnamed protein product [Miscanthus lutarioriparius]|uniref:Receptor kinase-like protein Xa21 n=1 Tax=Miscanthus lutarioriparius TaxID=422564 RepID=A0A811SMQ3_9POAL|nr:unnamed protein product [Miscanthus lutarioriparius]